MLCGSAYMQGMSDHWLAAGLQQLNRSPTNPGVLASQSCQLQCRLLRQGCGSPLNHKHPFDYVVRPIGHLTGPIFTQTLGSPLYVLDVAQQPLRSHADHAAAAAGGLQEAQQAARSSSMRCSTQAIHMRLQQSAQLQQQRCSAATLKEEVPADSDAAALPLVPAASCCRLEYVLWQLWVSALGKRSW